MLPRFEQLECRRVLTAVLTAGEHLVLPNRLERIPVLIQEVDRPLLGLNLRVQIGDGTGPQTEPSFAGFDVADSIWPTAVTLGGPLRDPSSDEQEFTSLLQAGVVPLEPTVLSEPGPHIVAHLLVDTRTSPSGTFDLLLDGHQIGADTDLAGDVATLLNGQINVARPGDANLDGAFNSSDLVTVFEAGEYEDELSGNSTWSEGDWDGDGDFTTRDLVYALQAGDYDSEPALARSRHAFGDRSRDALTDLAAAVWEARREDDDAYSTF